MIPVGVLVKSLRYCITLSFHVSFAAPTLCDHCLVTKKMMNLQDVLGYTLSAESPMLGYYEVMRREIMV